MSLKVTDHTAPVLAAIEQMAKLRVYVGIPQAASQREPTPDDPKPDITNAEIGFINEFGEPMLNIPARPHLVPGARTALFKVEILYHAAAKAQLNGSDGAVARAHVAVGLTVVSAIQRYMTTADFVPLAPFTIQKRLERGKGNFIGTGFKPLIDTGIYRRAMTYVVAPANALAKR